FLFRGEYIFLGGGIGFAITKHLTGLLGNFGTGALIVFALGAFITFTFNTSFGWLADVFARLKTAEKEEEEHTAPVETAAVAAAGVRVRAVKPTAEELAAADHLLAEEDSFEEADEEIEEEEVVEEELDLPVEAIEEEAMEVAPMALELETAPMEVLAPVASPVMSAADGLETEVDGMSVTAGAADKMLSEDQIEEKLKEFGEYDPTLDLSSYELPPIDLLVDHGTGELTVTREELEANKDRIVQT
ncbi:MAG TPA: hypothetical protein PL070_03155, partial [Flavobacteriales bacterium]|nr:hypothetical protein [Flavobacteriales bacterium]